MCITHNVNCHAYMCTIINWKLCTIQKYGSMKMQYKNPIQKMKYENWTKLYQQTVMKANIILIVTTELWCRRVGGVFSCWYIGFF